MKQETIEQLKSIIELHEEDSELSKAIHYLKMITRDNEPNVDDNAVNWIRWYRRIAGAGLIEARDEMVLRSKTNVII